MAVSLVRRIQTAAAERSEFFAFLFARARASNVLIRALLLALTVVCLPVLMIKSRRPVAPGRPGTQSPSDQQKDVYPLW